MAVFPMSAELFNKTLNIACKRNKNSANYFQWNASYLSDSFGKNRSENIVEQNAQFKVAL